MKKTSIPILLIIFLSQHMNAQENLSKILFDSYNNYKEKTITTKRIFNHDVSRLLMSHKNSKNISYEIIGESVKKKPIYLVRFGKGDIKVLVWSQMHGDESTATMALFDLFNFLSRDNGFNDLREKFYNNLSLYFIPMLNPDGAEEFERRNIASVDLNRDAARLEFPESKILKSVRDSLLPEFGFNLHDQGHRWAAGKTNKSATLSFLAPAFNYNQDINDVRRKTIQLILDIYNELNKFIPGHIGKWNDDFEPRAFGDNFVKWGTSSVLIESGGWPGDPEKQFIRKLNFVALLVAFDSIAEKSYLKNDTDLYFKIPENEKVLFDLILRNVEYQIEGESFKIDVGVNIDEVPTSEGFYLKSTIEDIGDLSTFFGLEELDCSGMQLEIPKVDEEIFEAIESLENLDFISYLKKGITGIKISNIDSYEKISKWPINLISAPEFEYKFGIGKSADFIIKRGEKVLYTIVNGQLYDVIVDKSLIKNGLILK